MDILISRTPWESLASQNKRREIKEMEELIGKEDGNDNFRKV
jgi:hypothetical protein